MKNFLTNEMAAALRLSREGRIKAAVAALRAKHSSPVQPGDTAPQAFKLPAPQAFKPPTGIISEVMEKLGSLSRSPLLDGLPGLGRRAPAIQPGSSRFEDREFANAAGSRKYKLFVPSQYKDQALPLVVMLHGCTQSPDDFAAGTRMNEIGEELGFFVAYPAQALSANITRCWNWFKPSDQQRDQGEPSIIAGLTRQIIGEFSILPGCVYIAGLSAGASTAAIMGITYPELFTAVGIHSGLAKGAASDLSSAMMAMRHGAAAPSPLGNGLKTTPAIVFHGDRDAIVNFANAAQVIAQFKGSAQTRTEVMQGKSAGGIAFTQNIQSGADGKPVLEEWVLHDVGHAWSGGSSAGSYTLPKGPDASREMARFFLQQRS